MAAFASYKLVTPIKVAKKFLKLVQIEEKHLLKNESQFANYYLSKFVWLLFWQVVVMKEVEVEGAEAIAAAVEGWVVVAQGVVATKA